MPRIPVSVIEEIKERCDIEEVISRYVNLKRAGSNYSGSCPFHSERTPSFTVFPATQSYYCFGCGAGGDVVSFVMNIENLSYIEALTLLADRAGVKLPTDSVGGQTTVSRNRIFEMNREAARFYRDRLFDERAGKQTRDYLIRRGLSSAIIKRFGLGYAPEGFEMSNYMRKKGYTTEELVAGFLSKYSERTGKPYDMFRGRVMFPIIDTSGRVVAFGGRIMGDGEPKYLNSSDTPAFKKSKTLYALNYAKEHCADELILCEGYMDVIALHNAGVENAVATLGTALTSEQARLMAKHTKRVVICYDSDEAGKRAASRAIDLLTETGLDVRILRLKGAKDPDEFIKKYGVDKFRDALAASSTKFNHVMSGILAKYDVSIDEDKIRALREINEYIAGIYSGVEREVYIHQASVALGISEGSIKSDVSFIINKKRRAKKKDESEELLRETAGYGDRINRDKLTQLRRASCEEVVLGMLVAYPEYIKAAVSDGDGALAVEDFGTEFGKRVFRAVTEIYRESESFDFGALSGEFSQEEVSRISKLALDRQKLNNDMSVYLENVRALKTESKRADKKSEDAFDTIKRLREKNKKNSDT